MGEMGEIDGEECEYIEKKRIKVVREWRIRKEKD
jgi:hypothetical protein